MADIADIGNETANLFLDAAFRSRERRTPVHWVGDAECEDCGEIIPAARIKAVPYTRRCIDCENEYQRTGGL